MSNYQRTADWLKACGKEPTAENLSVQIGCHIEETLEFFSTLDFSTNDDDYTMRLAIAQLNGLARMLKSRTAHARIRVTERSAALDALCDSEVTGNGIAYLAGFNKEAADAAVLDSNDAKLVNGKPVLLPGGKIGKPEGWTPPSLSQYV